MKILILALSFWASTAFAYDEAILYLKDDVLELKYSPTNASEIVKFAADFIQSCEGHPPLSGSILYLSTLNIP